MRILYNSKDAQYKTPFGTIRTGQSCFLRIDIPKTCAAVRVTLVVEDCDEKPCREITFTRAEETTDYVLWRTEFTLEHGLYFYWFRVDKPDGSFRLFRQGDETNMEAGEKWQLSSIPADFMTPGFAHGAIMYQILPDRFYQKGECDLSEKLRPFRLHQSTEETPYYTADAAGNWCNDFYGGNLAGISEKLPYLQEMGVEVLYLNPIFMAYSNHRYDTADYKRVDPMLGTETDFVRLCNEAHTRGMRVILDGVFSHTGSNSVYFDRNHVFGGGAVSDPNSPYRAWYRFRHYPDDYDAWWNMPTLPNVNELEKSYVNYVIEDDDSVIAHWLRLGADGFRLDVVDELPDEFVGKLKRRLRELKPDALLIGEVWEDASNKRAYSVSRRYFVDGELDSVMNYPWRSAILRYVKGEDDGTALRQMIEQITENYPPQVLQCVMNCLGTHDTARLLTVLGDDFCGSKAEKAERFLTPEQRKVALDRLLPALLLQFTLPGMPSVFYGDEAGAQGFEDPFCRCCYPWGREDQGILHLYRALIRLRKESPALRSGGIRITTAGGGKIAFERTCECQTAKIYVNRSAAVWQLGIHSCPPQFAAGLICSGSELALQPGGLCVILS